MSSQDSAPHQSRREQRRSQRLRALASSAYTATAGHLEIEPEERDGRAPRRWFPEPAAAWALGLLLVLTAAVTIGWMALSGGGEAVHFGDGAAESEPLAGAEPEAAQSGTEQDAAEAQVELPEEGDAPDAASATSGEEARIVVHVAGAVAEPGLVELPADARAGEAVDSAGGPVADADLSRVNLARPLTDGEQLYLPRIGEDAPEVTQPEPGAGAEAAPGPQETPRPPRTPRSTSARPTLRPWKDFPASDPPERRRSSSGARRMAGSVPQRISCRSPASARPPSSASSPW